MLKKPCLTAILFLPVITASLICTGIARANTKKPNQQHEQKSTRLANKILHALVEANGLPGMGACVWKDGKIVWSGSAGYRDIEKNLPVNNETIFRLASVSKIITVTAAARLKEEQKLDVDMPVKSILPYLDEKWAPLTSRQLAAHTSGLPHYQAVDQERGNEYYTSTHDAVEVFNRRALLSTPGTTYSYSSWGYTLLSAVIEKQSGMPFLDYVSRYITPGLQIGADATDRGNSNASIAYQFVDGKVQKAAAHDFSYTWGGGGFGATPKALAEFGGRLLQGKVVSKNTFDWMLQPAKLKDGSDVVDENYRVGFGWRTGIDTDGHAIAYHAGVTTGARSALVLWPRQSTAVSLLSNSLWVSSIEESAMMLAAPFKRLSGNLVKSVCPIEATNYQGSLGERRFSGTARFTIQDGICEGTIMLDKPMQDFFNSFPQKDVFELRIIGVDNTDSGLARAALITPIGIYDLRAQSNGMHKARYSSSKNFELRFE